MDKDNSGFFLVGVLVFCFILIPVIAVFAQSSRAVARSTNAADQQFRAEFLAAGLMEAVASRLTSDRDLGIRFRHEGEVGCMFGHTALRFRVQDHDGKIDLNNADSELLKAGFKAAGLSDENASIMQQFTEAFRSNNFSFDAEGAQAASRLPSLKHAPFERIEELNDAVAGLKLAPIDFEPYFTVYKRAGNLEYAAAPKVLQAVIDASPEIKGQVAADNGSFDYIDIAVDVTRSEARPYSFLKTYMRLTAAGEVRELASKNLPANDAAIVLSPERELANCGAILGMGEAVELHG